MKPTTHSSDNHHTKTGEKLPSKKSSSTSSKSRSKKLSQSANHQQSSSANDTSSGSSHDKNRYKNFAGISTKSVKCFWEQYDKNETGVTHDAFSLIAEDITYKLWEIGNTIKTYARHSGGQVTVDLVNEVMKDANVAPVIGAGTSQWDTVDYDGVYYFNSDKVLNLRDEYLKNIEIVQCGPLTISSKWLSEAKMTETLLHFFKHLCDALFLGSEEVFREAIETVATNPFISGILSLLLSKCIEMLAFEYKNDTLERTMELLAALTHNPFIRDQENNVELYYIGQLMVCLLLGPPYYAAKRRLEATKAMTLAKIRAELASIIRLRNSSNATSDVNSNENDQQNSVSSLSNNNYQQNDSTIPDSQDSMTNNMSTTPIKQKSCVYNGIDITNIKNECDAFFVTKENEEMNLAKEQEDSNQGTIADFNGMPIKSEIVENYEYFNGENGIDTNSVEIKTSNDSPEPVFESRPTQRVKLNENATLPPSTTAATGAKTTTQSRPNTTTNRPIIDEVMSETSSSSSLSDDENTDKPVKEEEYFFIITKMCDFSKVDIVCKSLGRLSSNWGFIERDCTFLVLQRLEHFFSHGVLLMRSEYEWLVRAVKALWSLGEIPFKELTKYFEKINPITSPEWINCSFNQAAIFIRGQRDIFFYEWLYDLCGDTILPFMIYNSRILNKFAILSLITKQPSASIYKILPKVLLKTLEKRKREKSMPKLEDYFQCHPMIIVKKLPPKIGFRFAGCRPVKLKPKGPICKTPLQDTKLLVEYNKKIVVARRKLLRPITNRSLPRKINDLRFMNL